MFSFRARVPHIHAARREGRGRHALLAGSRDGERWADWAYAARGLMGLLKPEGVAEAVLELSRDGSAVARGQVVGELPQG